MKKLKSKKTKATYLIVIMTVLVVGVVCLMFILTRTTTLVEDVNNNCQRQADGTILSTLVASKYVYFEIPSYKVDEYLKKAPDEGRCVFKKDAHASQ